MDESVVVGLVRFLDLVQAVLVDCLLVEEVLIADQFLPLDHSNHLLQVVLR